MIILTIPLKTLAGFLCFHNGGMYSFYIPAILFILLSGIISFVISKSLHCLYGQNTDLNLREFFIIITISMCFTTFFFLLLGHNILSYLLNLDVVYYVKKKIFFCEARLNYPWFLNILPEGNSGSSGQGSSNNPSGPPQGPQGPEGDFIHPIDPNSTRSRRRSSCSENLCYNDNEDRFGYIKKCHRDFIKTCEVRVAENKTVFPELSYGIDANIGHNTGLSFLDYTHHQLKSGIIHLNQQLCYDYVIFKPSGNPEEINGFKLTGRAKTESEGCILVLLDNKYTGLTNRHIQNQVIDVFKNKHL